MRKGMFRGKLTYANVTATLALVLAMSGGALAANHYLINSTKQINPKVLKKLHGARGARGSLGPTGGVGPQGIQGPEGKRGVRGEQGVAGFSALTLLPKGAARGWLCIYTRSVSANLKFERAYDPESFEEVPAPGRSGRFGCGTRWKVVETEAKTEEPAEAAGTWSVTSP
jgi:hypothetical protein